MSTDGFFISQNETGRKVRVRFRGWAGTELGPEAAFQAPGANGPPSQPLPACSWPERRNSQPVRSSASNAGPRRAVRTSTRHRGRLPDPPACLWVMLACFRSRREAQNTEMEHGAGWRSRVRAEERLGAPEERAHLLITHPPAPPDPAATHSRVSVRCKELINHGGAILSAGVAAERGGVIHDGERDRGGGAAGGTAG